MFRKRIVSSLAVIITAAAFGQPGQRSLFTMLSPRETNMKNLSDSRSL